MNNCSNLEAIGKRIKKLREEKGLTQEVFAKEMYITRQTVAKWETGRQDFKTQEIIKIADFFDVTCDYLLRGVSSELVDIHKQMGLSEEAIKRLSFLSRASVTFFMSNGQFMSESINQVLNALLLSDYFEDLPFHLTKLKIISEWQIQKNGFSSQLTRDTLKALGISPRTLSEYIEPAIANLNGNDKYVLSSHRIAADKDCDLERYKVLSLSEKLNDLFDYRNIVKSKKEEKKRILNLLNISEDELKNLDNKINKGTISTDEIEKMNYDINRLYKALLNSKDD